MRQFTTFLISILFIVGINAQTVPEVQQSMITKVTATWCSNCGSWGWNFYEDLSEDNDSKALMLKAHYSGDLVNSIGQDFGNNFNIQGQPRFIVNNIDQNATSTNTATKRTEIKQAVDDVFLETPTLNAGVVATLGNDELNISVRTKFFQATSGEFYTNVYLVEDNVIANQSGNSGGANTSHQDIIRMAANSSTFGELVASGTIDEGTESVQSYTVPVNAAWDLDNMEFVAIVWSKSEDTYSFENGSSATLDTSSPVKDIAEEIQLSIQPTLLTHDSNISIFLEEGQGLSIELIDLQGQRLRNIHTGNLAAGKHNFNMEKGNLANGVYLVSIRGDRGVATRRIIVQ